MFRLSRGWLVVCAAVVAAWSFVAWSFVAVAGAARAADGGDRPWDASSAAGGSAAEVVTLSGEIDEAAEEPVFSPEPWPAFEEGTEATGYDPGTGAVVPEGGRLEAEPEEAPGFGRPGAGLSGSRPPGSGRPGGGPGGGFGPKAEYRATWFPDRPVVGQVAELGTWRQDLSLSFPIAPVAKGLISGSVNIGSESTLTDAVLPDSGVAFPRDLSSVSLGANYVRQFDNGWTGGGGVSVGSASDEPFSDVDVLQVSANGFVRIPRGKSDAWLLSVFYAPMSEIPFPIPGVAYQWQPSDKFKANVGLPFSATYTPTEKLSFEATYLPIRTVRAKASYTVLESLKAYAGYERSNRSWFLADRVRDDDRLFSYDQRVASGFEWAVTEGVTADLSGGYAFDRFYFQGEDFGDRDRDRIDVEDGAFVAGRVEGRW